MYGETFYDRHTAQQLVSACVTALIYLINSYLFLPAWGLNNNYGSEFISYDYISLKHTCKYLYENIRTAAGSLHF